MAGKPLVGGELADQADKRLLLVRELAIPAAARPTLTIGLLALGRLEPPWVSWRP